MKVKFVKKYKVDAIDGAAYEEGQVVEMSQPSAMHFVRRAAAVEFVPPPVQKVEVSEPETEPERPKKRPKREIE